jgi:cytochrome c peroxidase
MRFRQQDCCTRWQVGSGADRAMAQAMFRVTAPSRSGAAPIAVCAALMSSMAVAQEIPLGLDRYLPVPESSPLTVARVELGRRLFFDPVLSRDRSLACASCHVPAYAFTDGRQVSRGIDGRVGTRNVPTLVNRAYGRTFFWDGRTTTLEDQVLRPIADSLEMGLPVDSAVARLNADESYVRAFADVFGDSPAADRLARALASFVRAILAGDAPLDRALAGDSSALGAQARAGLRLFRGKAGCVRCHIGPNFTDEQFHNTGVAWDGTRFTDPGRLTVTGNPADLGAFKTPTLREVARTAPYMHDGSVPTLEAVIEFYDGGGRANRNLDVAIHPLQLTGAEEQALVAFLRSLTSAASPGPHRVPDPAPVGSD